MHCARRRATRYRERGGEQAGYTCIYVHGALVYSVLWRTVRFCVPLCALIMCGLVVWFVCAIMRAACCLHIAAYLLDRLPACLPAYLLACQPA